MRILLLESFYTSSHKQWADGLQNHFGPTIDLLTLPGRHWKWRMEHSAIYFSELIRQSKKEYDLILATDMVNIAVLKGLLSSFQEGKKWYNNVPIYLYFHENQITYPWSESDPDILAERDNHYGWINYLSSISADRIFFNSHFHKRDFLESLPTFLGQFPGELPIKAIQEIERKSKVLYIGLETGQLLSQKQFRNTIPIILWNHRWEYDKNPNSFFDALFSLQQEGLNFRVIIAGEKYKRYPEIFDQAKEKLSDKILHFGYAKDRADYLHLLGSADIVPITSNQDFYGISALEAMLAGAYPILPDRLAFQEHITLSNRSEYYYKTDRELLQKMRGLLTSGVPDTSTIQQHLLKYDWQNVIETYQKALRIR